MPLRRHPSIFSVITILTLPLASACEPDGADNLDDAAAVARAPDVEDDLFTLGQALFFDPLLSGNQDLSCATCHHPSIGTDDNLALSHGVGGTGLGTQREGGAIIPRNAPALFNLHEYRTMFWDSRVTRRRDGGFDTPAGAALTPEMERTLEHGIVAAQAMFPVTSADEMRGQPGDNELASLADDDFSGIWSALMTRLGNVPAYVALFEAAYPATPFRDMTFAHAANAIAAYEIRAFERRDSPYQRFLDGDEQALSQAARQGLRDFNEAGCDNCHSGPLLSDFEHHNTALAQFGPGKGHGTAGTDDFGRAGVTGQENDRYAFRTPPLINVALTGPFGHAGQYTDLREFVAHYRDAARELQQYEVRTHVEQQVLWPTLVPNTAAILETIDRRLRNGRRFDVDNVVAFLMSTTADSAHDLNDVIPTSVPSGLPID